jgi:multidrug efflux system outer membrane protein
MQARQLRETVRALIGAHANDMPPMQPAPLPATRAGVPDELSYRLLARRPDLQAMRWYAQASLSQVEMAKAMFYPTFDIKAFFGLDAIHIEDLFSQRSAVVHVIPGLTLPIFDGGRLNANLKSARASSDTMIEQYNGAVLRAVRDVAVAGTRLQALQEQERLQEERVKQSQIVLQSARAHRDRGLVSQSRSLEAELPVFYLQAELAEIRGRRVAEHIALVRALGGGYDSEARGAATPSASADPHRTAIPERSALR